MKKSNTFYFNVFSFLSTFARAIIEIYVPVYLYKNGLSIHNIIVFYLLVYFISTILSYALVKFCEKTNYLLAYILSIISFLLLQLGLEHLSVNILYLTFLAFLFAMYKRGYWICRRFYITHIVPNKKSSKLYSIISVLGQVSKIIAAYIGAIILDIYNLRVLTIISVILLLLSSIFLHKIKIKSTKCEINLRKSLKESNKKNFIIFAMYEINNVIVILFSLYIMIYVNNKYLTLSNFNAISNVAIIIFSLVYGKIINDDKNHLLKSFIFIILIYLFKVNSVGIVLMIVCFLEGIITQMQTQSVNKVYFEKNEKLDVTNYNLLYQLLECITCFLVLIPLYFLNNLKLMIYVVIGIIIVGLIIYIILDKSFYKKAKGC